MIVRIFGVLIFLIVVSVGGLVFATGSPTNAVILVVNQTIGQPVAADAPPVHVIVRPGETAATLGDELAAQHIIRSSLAFRTVVRLRNLGSTIEAGDYDLKPSTDVSAVAGSFAVGRLVDGQVTVPEGWRAFQIADALERAGVTPRADFLAMVANPNADLGSPVQLPTGRSLEGYLYPDTYGFSRNSDPAVVIKQLVANFARHLSPELQTGFTATHLDLNSAVSLASIVEREAVVPTERPIIASVYVNRLRRGMRLQADPTVQFAVVTGDGLGVGAAGYWKHSLTVADLALTSPYNTYVVTGLPPGPICSPGAASLAAVAHPALTDFLYFVARPDGTHAFARTLEEHEKNIKAIQQAGGGT